MAREGSSSYRDLLTARGPSRFLHWPWISEWGEGGVLLGRSGWHSCGAAMHWSIYARLACCHGTGSQDVVRVRPRCRSYIRTDRDTRSSIEILT